MMAPNKEDEETLLQEPDEFEDIPFSEKRPQPPRKKSCLQSSLRLMFEVTLVFIIIALLIQPYTRRIKKKPGPVPSCESAIHSTRWEMNNAGETLTEPGSPDEEIYIRPSTEIFT